MAEGKLSPRSMDAPCLGQSLMVRFEMVGARFRRRLRTYASQGLIWGMKADSETTWHNEFCGIAI